MVHVSKPYIARSNLLYYQPPKVLISTKKKLNPDNPTYLINIFLSTIKHVSKQHEMKDENSETHYTLLMVGNRKSIQPNNDTFLCVSKSKINLKKE